MHESTTQCDFGLIGLAVMGQNLALNVERNGFSVAVYNRTAARTKEFMAERAVGKNIVAGYTIEEFVGLLKKPRKIMLMVKAGAPVDAVIEQLKPHLEPGDLLIDGGNSFFGDTERRAAELERRGILYIGTGVSGGEYGALYGPSIMPGGQKEAYALVEPIFKAIAARVDGDPCVTYIGPRGAGHYVKMVHNGIEYGDMQLIAESYDILSRGAGLSAAELHEVFAEWNQGELSRGDRQAAGGGHPGRGEAERHRQVDVAERAGPGRAYADHQRRRRIAHYLLVQRRARGSIGSPLRPYGSLPGRP